MFTSSMIKAKSRCSSNLSASSPECAADTRPPNFPEGRFHGEEIGWIVVDDQDVGYRWFRISAHAARHEPRRRCPME